MPLKLKQIVVVPQYGLANRIRAMAYMRAFSVILRKPFKVHWVSDEHCDCDFTSLFESSEFILRSLPSNYKLFNHMLREGGTQSREVDFFSGEQTVVVKTAFRPHFVLPKKTLPFLYFGLTRRLTVYYARRFFQKELRPASLLQTKVESYCPENAIGVHIRRMDTSKPNIDFPDYAYKFNLINVETFKTAISEQLYYKPSARVYLATNSAAVEEELRSEFGSNLIIHPKKTASERSTEAVQDALIDFLALSRTQLIIGTRASSFGKMAAFMGGREIIYPENTPSE